MKTITRVCLFAASVALLSVNGLAQTPIISTVAGDGSVGYGGDGRQATSAQINSHGGIALDPAGNLYIADISPRSLVRKVTPAGIISTIAGNGTQGFSGDGGPATLAQLNAPRGLAVDSAGNVYIADTGNNRIRKVTSAGVISTVAGNGTGGFAGDGGPAASAQLNSPRGVALDMLGNVYIADVTNHRVRQVSTAGVISTAAGTGTPGFSGDNGPAASAQLNSPRGVAVDGFGNLYIADVNNNRVRRVSGGVIITVAGNGIAGFSGDGGPAISASFNSTSGGYVAVDSTGTLYISDINSNRIRKVAGLGISTFAGTGVAGFSGDGGPAASAQINTPEGIAVDSSDNVYYSDEGGRVRKIQLPSSSWAFSLGDRAATSIATAGSGSNIDVGFGRIEPSSGTAPSGIAIFGFRSNNVLVSEAGVPASPRINSGRIYAEISADGLVNTGLAIANPNGQTATINFSFTNAAGVDLGSGTMSVESGGQTAKFLNQDPFNASLGFQGTFTFTSNVGVAVVALRGFTNQRNEFLITTLPVIDLSASPSSGAVFLPHFADGGGWTTQVILVNPTDSPMAGTVQFSDGAGLAVNVSIGGQTASSFSYSIPRRSSQKLATAGVAAGTSAGSVRITPTGGGTTPTPLVVFSFKPGAITVAEAGVQAISGTAFRMYVESSGPPGLPGNIQTGLAVANTSATPVTVTFDLTNMDGSPSGLPPASVLLPAFGQTAGFLAQVFPSLPASFSGLLRITTSSGSVAAVGLRGRFNERGDFLITTTPPTVETGAALQQEVFFPHVANGGGYTTQFILFSGVAGQTATGTVRFKKQDSSALRLF